MFSVALLIALVVLWLSQFLSHSHQKIIQENSVPPKSGTEGKKVVKVLDLIHEQRTGKL